MGTAVEVRLHLFGPPAVESGGTTLALAFERRTQLAVLLALRGEWVPRAELATMLWPEQSGKLAFANLRKTLFRLPSLRWAEALELQTAALRFGAATDVAAFESAVRDGRIAEALALYRGDLLAGFDDGQSEAWTRWLTFERDRLRAAWRSTALAHLDGGVLEPATAIALAVRLLEADPLDEAALRHQMSALARDGQAGAARAAYRQFVERLKEDLGLDPGVELRALHETLAGAPRRAAPEAGAAVSPAIADGFVGRSVELQRIADLLSRDECRLLCLVGPGGVGKTRLARRAMQLLAPEYADGTAFVALEDVETPVQFGLRLAQEAGVATGQRSGDALARAIDAWRERRLLLVLDNFEQLAEHAPLLERMLEECPRMKILVTSRLRLVVADEWSMPVEGLPYPDPEDRDRVEAFDAVRLFVNVARRVEPAFSAAAEREAIVDICRQVEGLPLALELAAAWVRVLSCREIAQELRQGTELLRATDARHPARHASIEAVFDNSWRRLADAERTALARLAVFHGGFSAETARAVTGASLPVLGSLVDKSLLAKDRARMHLHPLVQQLAALKLEASGARAATEAAHAAYFHRWLQQLEAGAASGQRDVLQAIDTEFENCRRAWACSIARGKADELLRSLPALHHYFEDRARFEDGLALLRQGVESDVARADDGLLARLLGLAALMEMRLARYADAEATAARALAVAHRPADRDARYRVLAVQGGCALATGRPTEARRIYRRGLALAKALARASDIASTLDNLALCEKRLGHYDEALALTLEALGQHRRHGDHARLAVCLNNLGSMYTFLDEDDAARAHLSEGLVLCERHGLTSTRAFVLANLTELALKSDDADAAREHAERAIDGAEQAGLRSLVAWLKVQLARLAARRGEPDAARTLLADAAELAVALGAQSVKPAVVMGFAELLEAQGHPAAARRVLGFAADDTSLSAPDRDELRAAWARRASPDVPDPPWPGLSLAELLQRIAAEAGAAHEPLIAALHRSG
jgi:predicted ATPase/DNA-binding SARP family transcriptional activator